MPNQTVGELKAIASWRNKNPQKPPGLLELNTQTEKGKENNAKLKIRLKGNRCKRNKQKERESKGALHGDDVWRWSLPSVAKAFAAEADAGYSRGLHVAVGRNLLRWPLGHAIVASMRKLCRPKTAQHKMVAQRSQRRVAQNVAYFRA